MFSMSQKKISYFQIRNTLLAAFILAQACASKEQPQPSDVLEIDSNFGQQQEDEFASPVYDDSPIYDDTEATPFSGAEDDSGLAGVEDYTLADHQSFDPSGILIHFEFDKAELTEEGLRALDQIIEGMKKDPFARLVIRGHTDKQGPEAYNDQLSERRSKAIKDYLINNGIDEDRLRPVPMGSREPLIDENRVSAYKKNRRGDFYINYGPSAFGQ